MRAIRFLMADRGLGGAIVSLIAYLVVLQGLAAAVSEAAMADPGASPVGVLCSGGFAPADPGDRSADTGHAACCMTFCRAACLSGAGLPSDAAGVLVTRAVASWKPTGETVAAQGPHPLPLLPEARAPPAHG